MISAENSKVIVVTGDVTADWNIARLRKSRDKGGQTWNADDTARVCFQPGGAAMLADVVEAAARKIEDDTEIRCDVRRIRLPQNQINTRDSRYHHSYAIWKPYQYKEKQAGPKKWVWRVEEYLGLDQADDNSAVDRLKLPDDPAKADVVVLDDAALGFRDNRALWPQAILRPENCGWIVIKAASPVAQGPLWEHLIGECAPLTIALLTVNDLRRTEANISRVLSWERTAQDIFWEMVHNPMVNGLSRCAHVVVSLGTSGALLLSQAANSAKNFFQWKCRLFFDPRYSEGAWGREYPGWMIGSTTCMAAAISRQLLLKPEQPDLDRAVQSGIESMRCLHMEGYGPSQNSNNKLNPPAFPVKQVVEALSGGSGPLSVAEVQDPVRFLHEPHGDTRRTAPGFWTVLDDACSAGSGKENYLPLDKRAEIIVTKGLGAGLKDLPLGQFGGLTTADRHEIESFRSIQALIAEYCSTPRSRPLSIAVFGPPGSGKSFGVKQVAKSIQQADIKDCTFNLSQYNGPDDLVDAFHQVRDISLSGKIPLVFWDEFDTALGDQKNGWLRCFLSPMQDGQFQDKQITYHIGRAIFVFAGGTCACFEDFDREFDDALNAMDKKQREDAKKAARNFKDAKGPDFVSRLSGFINIMGPNIIGGSRDSDRHYIIRRAIVLRSLFERCAPHFFSEPEGKGILNIDPGVLRAFLNVSNYKHGVRSIETIINMSTLSGRSTFERSCLPPEAQLNLHVDGREFLSLVQLPDLGSGELLEKLARANHQVYCASQKGKPDAPGESSLTYDELPPHLKRQNEDNVRNILVKLSSIGHVMTPARSDDPPFDFPGPHLEKLAEMEHRRWLEAKMAAGWKYGENKDDVKKENPAVRPWRKLTDEELSRLNPQIAAAILNEDLPEDEKDKDRDLVRGIPELLKLAGYTIVDLHKTRNKETKCHEDSR